jgi:hypothetical protein
MLTVLTTDAKSNAGQTCPVDIPANDYAINVFLVMRQANYEPTMALVGNSVDAAIQHVPTYVILHAMVKILVHHVVRLAMFAVVIQSVAENATSRAYLVLRMNVCQHVPIANARCLVRLPVTMSHVRSGARRPLNAATNARRCAEKLAPLLSFVRFVATRKSKIPWSTS